MPARARRTVRLLAGGVRLISVEDDGGGIPREELGAALKRHATSKIGNLAEELEAVHTMGFRARRWRPSTSIADVSLLSREAGSEDGHAWMLHGRTGELSPAGAHAWHDGRGARELFYATPARRKFLKSDATELAHCLEAVRRHARSRGRCRLRGLARGPAGRAVARLPASRTRRRRWRSAWATCCEDFIAQSLALDWQARACVSGAAPACRTRACARTASSPMSTDASCATR